METIKFYNFYSYYEALEIAISYKYAYINIIDYDIYSEPDGSYTIIFYVFRQ